MRRSNKLERALAEAERAQTCLWTRDRALKRVIDGRLACGELLAVRDDLFVRPSYWASLTYWQRIMHMLRAVAERRPDWPLCQISAAAVWRLHGTYTMHDRVHVAVDDRTCTRNRSYFRFHHLKDARAEIRDGILVTSLMQTVFDCIRTLRFPPALAICDAAMRLYGLARDELATFIDERAGHKGVEQARLVASHADPRSENGGESIARAWMLIWGYEPPELQYEIVDPVSRRLWRTDFKWTRHDGATIIGELDGREKYVNPDMIKGADAIDTILAEKEREGDLRLLGNTVFVRFTFNEVVHAPELVRRRLDLAGVPRAAEPLRLLRRRHRR
ncbi:hypothetical protein [Bifidobacterium avesanii]|uniref:CTP synthase n=1 Tax=Bifidobacterium avesanii TaxID=1798157 RepID=A0A7K3TJ42_9BIFI|nr:hypothetical protein [Bifidobacterium avesanii]KAB8288244.1 hypothetical protein DSM100685_1774 [Bifidobacterium avesanii]NEG78719.1 hypothetical protein [Bifidobacterium avesanii]